MPNLFIIYFFYGLAFFCMGLGILLELGHATDERLRHSLRPLAAFGIIHGSHEWMEMFEIGGYLSRGIAETFSIDLVLMAFSFLSLGAFGSSLLARDERRRRFSLLLPLLLAGIWGIGCLVLRGHYVDENLWDSVHAWTRYSVGIPAALFAFIGLIYQQREFRLQGMEKFGRDSMWAAVAFLWYGLIGQAFPHYSPLFPANIVNQELFLNVFGFPIQLVRALAAIMIAIFVLRFTRSFEVETKLKIDNLQAERLKEAKDRDVMRGEMLHRIVSAQEAERQRIARELHDATGQALTAIGLGLRGIAGGMKNGKAAENLRQLEVTVEQSLLELQRMISDLRPSHLDDLGLNSALRWYAGEIEARVPLKVKVEIIGHPVDVSAEVKTCVFRIVQEAITNVVKHSQAKKTSIELDYMDDSVQVQIDEDGIGFNPDQTSNTERVSWGLIGMKERANLLGGEFNVYSIPNKGTRIVATIPYIVENEKIGE